jgi:hypothetical protein
LPGTAEQARTLVALRKSNAEYKALLDRAALAADASLHASSRYEQVGVEARNGWQRQADAGVWGSDWFGRAQAGVTTSWSTTITNRSTSFAAPMPRARCSKAATATR